MSSTKTQRRPKTPAPHPITQAELAAVLNTYNSLALTATEIRRRMDAGAEIEPGALKAEDSDAKRPIVFEPTRMLDVYHLDITPADFVAPEPATVDPAKTWSEKHDERTALMASRLVIAGLGDTERAFLATCQQIHHEDAGCTTPFQQFFHALVYSVEQDTWPTPENVRDELETFARDWNDMRNIAARFVERYPAAKEEAHA